MKEKGLTLPLVLGIVVLGIIIGGAVLVKTQIVCFNCVGVPSILPSPSENPNTIPNPYNLISVAKGQYSDYGNQEPTAVVVINEAEWKNLWTKHNTRLEILPKIDFSQRQVVGVFLGPSGGGDTVEITAVFASQAKIVINAIQKTPKSNCLVPAVITSPFHLVSTPIINGEVELNLSKQKVDCN